MLELRMVSKEKFAEFFTIHQIPWRGEKPLEGFELHQLLDCALNIGQIFHSFILLGLLNASKTKIETNFDDPHEAYEMYQHFTAGFSKYSSNN